ncbi:MAG: heme A synthase, partial [Alphaproteobacteria bacterium]|nr:heme A synthase [Alphaproteobacteria bacterium]
MTNPALPPQPRPSQGDAARRPVVIWLALMAAMVFAMVVIGGITRLTESGLSIVEWRPVTGVLPPLNEQAWQALYDQYRASPEF